MPPQHNNSCVQPVVGIDPGKSGGIAILDENGSVVLAEKLRFLGKRKDSFLDVHWLCSVLDGYKIVICEWSRPYGINGKLTWYSVGEQHAVLRTVVKLLGSGFFRVPPKVWQSMYGLDGLDYDDRKRKSTETASRRYSMEVTKDGVADALLIAGYARKRMLDGTNYVLRRSMGQVGDLYRIRRSG